MCDNTGYLKPDLITFGLIKIHRIMKDSISLIIAAGALAIAGVRLYKKYRDRAGSGEKSGKGDKDLRDYDGEEYEPYKRT